MNTTEVSVYVVCPACGAESRHDVDALTGSGGFPQNLITCPDCKTPLIVEADVTVYTRLAATQPERDGRGNGR